MGLLPNEVLPHRVLEVGCGTGLLTQLLMRRYSDSLITAIDIAPGMIEECRRKWPVEGRCAFLEADVESMTLAGEFDLIISNSCFQWLTDLRGAMHKLASHLRAGGVLAFSAPAAGTLSELSRCYQQVAPSKAAGHALPDADDYFTAVSETGLESHVAEKQTLVFIYERPEHVLRSLKGLGATRAMARDGAGLSRSQIRGLLDVYARDFRLPDGCVTCTYTTAYVRASR